MSRTDIPRKDKFALMRRRFRHQMFLSGARDVIEARPVAASLADSTAAADEAVNVAYVAAGRLSGLAVLALGRLGSSEFDCLSDVDLLFVRGPNENAQVLTIAAETMVAALSSYTNEGTVFPVDLRLRPHGGEGEMTITPVVLGRYIATEAQSWEALTYTKLRFVGGDERLGAEAVASVVMAYARFGEENNFGEEVREMRLKLEAQTDEGNIRTAPGGMYDIDFLVAFLVVKHGVQTVSGNTRERLKHLGRAGLIQAADLQVLLDASELFRTTEHAVRLVTGRALRELPVSDNARTSVEGIVERILGPQKNQLQDLLSQTSIRVRKIFERTVH
jgi:glutamate-ammonia-ligase adenylyltransferase